MRKKKEAEDALLRKKAEEKNFGETDEKTGEPVSATRSMEEDVNLFHELFPDVKEKDIPSEVWARVEQGESLAAAYALYTVQKARREEEIRLVNEENAKKAPPRIHYDGGQGEYFSPEAVRKMTRSEVKKHYDAILRSMEHWN